jgi:hypothetical protein
MLPTERRAKLIRLLATIDQQIAEMESLASDAELTESERRYATAQLDFQRRAVKRVEAMLIPFGGRHSSARNKAPGDS